MPVDLRTIPRTQAEDWQVVGAMLSPDSRSQVQAQAVPTVPTAAGTTRALVIMPFDGLITSVRWVFIEGLPANSDTNFAQFRCINKSAADAPILLATNVNSTALTLGAVQTAYTQRTGTLATASGVAVSKFDVLEFQVIGNGTLPNTLTAGRVQCNLLVST